MPRHTRYVKNKRVGQRGTVIRGDQIFTSLDGLVGGATGHNLYAESAIQRYDLGARRLAGDGRVFRYAKAGAEVTSTNFGLKFWDKLADGIAYTAPLQVQAVGDKTILVDSGHGAAGIAKDELRGGYIIVHTHGDSYNQNRLIVGNTLADASGYITITVDGAWTIALTLAFGVEVLQNPYADVRVKQAAHGGGGDGYSSVAGMPMCKTTAANMYLWIQTWGPIWINPHGASLQDADLLTDERQLVFDYEGSVTVVGDAVNTTVSLQHAGFIIDRTASLASGPPLVMLQISP